MARLISAKGVTASGAIGSPMEGMKWIVKWAMIIMHTGTGTGNRSANLSVWRANNSISVGPELAGIPTQSATSNTFSGTGDVVSNQVSNNAVIYYQFPEVYAVDAIVLYAGLVTGDTVDYYVMVEEMSS